MVSCQQARWKLYAGAKTRLSLLHWALWFGCFLHEECCICIISSWQTCAVVMSHDCAAQVTALSDKVNTCMGAIIVCAAWTTFSSQVGNRQQKHPSLLYATSVCFCYCATNRKQPQRLIQDQLFCSLRQNMFFRQAMMSIVILNVVFGVASSHVQC